VALVRVPFYFINLLPTSILYISILLSRHYWVGIWHGGVLGVHESLWVRDHLW
jgi:hypothetical protein